jgi:hypothetical protein
VLHLRQILRSARRNWTPIAFVLTDDGSGFLFVQAESGNALLTGSGRLRNPAPQFVS